MNTPKDNAHEKAQIEQMVRFDEALRLGRRLDNEGAADPASQETQAFLLYLQTAWKRKPKTIGRFTLIRTLGSGSVGPSYLVEAPGAGKPFVLKVLWPDLNMHSDLRQQMVVEAKLAQLLPEDRVVPVREISVTGTVCMFVADYNEGPSLAEWLHKKTPAIPWEVAVAFVANVADILEMAHSQGITHGNLKPSNIMLGGPGPLPMDLHQTTVRVADVGLAKAVLQARLPTKNSLPWPMPHYLAPEQLGQRAKPAGLACDLYALGVLLYELLTNASPVKGSTREEIHRQTCEITPTPPKQLCPKLPEDINELVMKCLAKQPQQRHGSAKLLAEACRGSLPGARESKIPQSWWRRWLVWK